MLIKGIRQIMQVLLEKLQVLLTCCAGQGGPQLKMVSTEADSWKELSDLMQMSLRSINLYSVPLLPV